jgi:hypothetical protein
MTATTVDRNSPAQYLQREQRLPLTASAVVPAGVIVAVNAAGTVPTGGSSDAPGLVVCGRSAHAADESDGDEYMVADRGVFGFAGTAALVSAGQAMVGRTVYLEDNQTVGLLSDTVYGIPVGILEEIDDSTFYVSVGVGPAGAVSGASVANVANSVVAASGNVQLGVPVLIALTFADAATTTYTYENETKLEIIDVWNIKDAAGAANTIQVTSIADVAITNAMAYAVDKTLTRAGTIDLAQRVLDAGEGFKVVNTRAAGSAAGQLFILAIPRA